MSKLSVMGRFEPDTRIAYGTLVITRPLHSLVWAGPVTLIPDWVEQQENLTLRVHPALLERIETSVKKVTKGIPYDDPPGAA